MVEDRRKKVIVDGIEKYGEKVIPMIKYYNVFHETQINNLDANEFPNEYPPIPINEAYANAEELRVMYCERVGLHYAEVEGSKAFYRKADDVVCIPKRTQEGGL